MGVVSPRLPIHRANNDFKGYKAEYYQYNGWVYDLEPGTYVIALVSSPVKMEKPDPGTGLTFRLDQTRSRLDYNHEKHINRLILFSE